MEKLKSYSNQNLIRKKLIKIMEETFHTRVEFLSGEYDNVKLTGSLFHFAPRDLVYLLFEVERVFNIDISTNAIINNRFNSIKDIVTIIDEEQAYHNNTKEV